MIDRVAIAPASDEASVQRAIVDRARSRGFVRFVLDRSPTAEAGEAEVWVRAAPATLRGPNGAQVTVTRVAELPELERAVAATPDGGVLAVEWTGDRVIPLESAVARRGRRFTLWTFARTPSEVPAALGALEHGADRVIVTVRTPAEVDELERWLDGPVPADLDWKLVSVTEREPAGTGDRVIVDTTSLLAPEEGLLVGSQAGFLFHVASEAVGSAFSRPRPFRVNAGAAHSYTLLADGTTRYLAELEANDRLLAVIPQGPARAVRVGRIKVERRPLVVVRAKDVEGSRTVFLQEAETVRLTSEQGRVPTTALEVGARLFGVALPAARHLGTAIEEAIEER